MKTILITGGAGFIGSALTRYMFSKYSDYKIMVLDCLTYAGTVENLPISKPDENNERFVFWYGNITNGELVDKLVSQSDMVVHLAAETHVARSISNNVQFFHSNILGTQTVANAIRKHKDRIERFIHISTSEVYGAAETEKMDESHPLNPMSPYAAAKVGADRLVSSYWATYGIPAVIVRPFNNYGIRQHPEKVIPKFITNILLGETLNIHGCGLAARDFVFVKDNCEAIDLVLHARAEKVIGKTFNVGSGQPRSILSVAEDIIQLMPFDNGSFIHVDDRPGQVTRHTADYSKIKNILGWKPKITWNDGLRETIDWYRDNSEWWKKKLWARND